jgi:hypothetical protein
MMTKHLTLADLERYIQGEEKSGYIRQHLQECEECLKKFRDLVSLRQLARPPREEPGYMAKPSGRMVRSAARLEARKHIPETLMASYYDGTMEPVEMDRVRAHLDSCSRCLNEYLSLKRSDRTPATDSPSLALVDSALRRFPGWTRRVSLGRARIEKILDGLRVVLLPVPEPAVSDLFLAADIPLDVLREKPAYKRAPVDREPSEPEKVTLDSREAPPPIDKEISLDAGDLRIVVSAGQEKKEPILIIKALDRESGKPAPEIPLKVSPVEGYPSKAVTGPDGSAALTITPGRSRLEITAEGIFTLDLDFPQ